MTKLFIREIKSPGDLSKERVVVRVRDAADVGDYLLFTARASEKGIYSGQGLGFWLENHDVNKGDTVVIYTKEGEYKTKAGPDGRTSHFIYLGRNASLWNQPDKAAVLFEVGSNWSRCRAGGFAQDEDTEPSQASE